MRPGGETPKLADGYEEHGTISELLQVLDGNVLRIEPEPIENGLEVEFIRPPVIGEPSGNSWPNISIKCSPKAIVAERFARTFPLVGSWKYS